MLIAQQENQQAIEVTKKNQQHKQMLIEKTSSKTFQMLIGN